LNWLKAAENSMTVANLPEALARLIMTLFKGMSLQAAEGATKDELHQIAENGR
jgi:hypothetical protein